MKLVKTADKKHQEEKKLENRQENKLLAREELREEMGGRRRSKSKPLYLTSMINVQEYASEAAQPRGWHPAELHCT